VQRYASQRERLMPRLSWRVCLPAETPICDLSCTFIMEQAQATGWVASELQRLCMDMAMVAQRPGNEHQLTYAIGSTASTRQGGETQGRLVALPLREHLCSATFTAGQLVLLECMPWKAGHG
jgi:hypothetical protein